ncbi:MAG: sulfotransferase domain-containing protein, partial [Kiloniellaceae bacterium]
MYAVIQPALGSLAKKLSRKAVLGAVFFLPAARRRRIERWWRGREQHGKLKRADCVVVSFGKSGRTWLRVLLSRVYQVKHGLPEHYLIGFDNLHRINRAVPRIFFTHDTYLADYTGHADKSRDYAGRKVILLVRHPADVAVSQFHQWRHRMRPGKKALNRYPAHGEEVGIFDFVAREEAGLAKAIAFLNAWAAAIPRIPDILIVRYEALRARPEQTLAEILAFIGTPGSEAEVREAVRFASFENMKRKEAARGF